MILDVYTDRYVNEVIDGNEYSFLFNDLVVIDIGCNIGTFSLWINKLAREIYAIDIAKENIEALDKAIAENNVKNIKTFNCGIDGESRKAEIAVSGTPFGGGWKLSSSSGDLDVYSLKDFMDRNKIQYADVVKMDVEGSEYSIISADDFPGDRIGTIVGEIHYGVDKESLMLVLRRHGFRYYDLGVHFMARR